jgi:hypothetical protein
MKCDRVSQHSRNKSPRFKGLESFYMTGLAIQTFVRAGAQVMRRVNLQVEGRASRPSGGRGRPPLHRYKWQQSSYLARLTVRARGVGTGWRSSDWGGLD